MTLHMWVVYDLIIDYKATYLYGIRNERALLIVLHWAALK